VYATSLRNAARSFARLATLEGMNDADTAAVRRVRAAMLAAPEYVAGTGRFDTDLMRVTKGSIACKAGAEGVHGDALLAAGVGLVVKVVDGTRRATAPATIALLRELGALDTTQSAALDAHARVDVKNVAGRIVGEISALTPVTESNQPARL
jgi:L-asparaginase II